MRKLFVMNRGQTVGHYRIVELLGAGGMGEVYQAHDTKLNRAVALKVLPPQLVSDPERRRRFVQEAQAASALDHPNIVTIYDIIEVDGHHCIVMQYVKGRTLRELIRHGLGLSRSIDYAIQISEGLMAAHSAGIVHRDLKPDNVIVDETGRVKILDFGLAKLTQPEDVHDGETRDRLALTQEGHILGTAAYMSPEQAQGKDVDARSDVFSFGSVLYEMLTGKGAFGGDNVASVVAAVIRDDPPPLSQAVSEAPPELEALLRRTLAKDPSHRPSSMREVKTELERIRSAPKGSPAWLSRRRLSAAAVLIVVGAFLYLLRDHLPLPSPSRSPSLPSRLVPVTSYPGDEYYPAVSPDGSRVAFLMDGDVYIQNITGGDALQLTETPVEEESVAWTPDAQRVTFLRPSETGHEIYSIPALGGAETRITRAAGSPGSAFGLSWSPDGGRLAYPASGETGEPMSLYVLDTTTGETTRLTHPPAGSIGDRNPIFSPDGNFIAFIRMAERAVLRDIYVMESKGEDAVPVTSERSLIIGFDWIADGRGFVYSSDRQGDPSLYRIDISGGEPRPVEGVDGIATWPSVFREGSTLVYEQRNFDWNVWRAPGPRGEGGEPTMLFGSTRLDGGPEYSPDGTRIAFLSTRSGSMEIWMCNSDGSSPTQLTSLGKPALGPPRWSPDGERITFGARLDDHLDVFIIDARGGVPVRLTKEPSFEGASSWSRDGRCIYFVSDRSGSLQIWRMSADGGDLMQLTEKGGVGPIESFDGKFVYFAQIEGGGGGVWRVPSSGGGEEELVLADVGALRWSLLPDGIAYINENDEFWFLDFASRARNWFGAPTGQLQAVGGGVSVSPDGRWFLYVQNNAAGDDIMMLENFR